MSTKIICLDRKDLGGQLSRMLTPEQSRAARGWLNWTQQELAGRAGVGLSTLRAFEAGQRMPIRNNLEALERAIEGAGIRPVFDQHGAAGIALGDAGQEPASLSELGTTPGTGAQE
jgi:transcriptional regulator with XRE-family HTH domain